MSKKGRCENNSETTARISFKFGTDVPLGGHLCLLSWLPQGRFQRVKGRPENNSTTVCRISFKFGTGVPSGGWLCLLSWHLQGQTCRAAPSGNVNKKGRPENNSAPGCRILLKFVTDIPSRGWLCLHLQWQTERLGRFRGGSEGSICRRM